MRNQKRTRKTKISNNEVPNIKLKFKEENTGKLLSSFSPTSSQKEFISKIHNNKITFVDSEAGVGKTSAALFYFCKEYLQNPYKQIIVVRTPVEIGADKLGFLSGDYHDKCAAHFESAKIIIENLLGKGRFEADFGTRIHFKVPNYMLGSTFDESFILIDEVQQLQPEILKLVLERTGNNTKVVVAGCSNQLYGSGKYRNALADAIERFTEIYEGERVSKYDDIDLHTFDVEDVMRDEIVKTVIRAYSSVRKE